MGKDSTDILNNNIVKASSIASLMVPHLNADIISVESESFSVSFNDDSFVRWDIDQDGYTEFIFGARLDTFDTTKDYKPPSGGAIISIMNNFNFDPVEVNPTNSLEAKALNNLNAAFVNRNDGKYTIGNITGYGVKISGSLPSGYYFGTSKKTTAFGASKSYNLGILSNIGVASATGFGGDGEAGVDGVIGFQFQNRLDGAIRYGWAEVTYVYYKFTSEGRDKNSFTVNAWHYEDSGASILANPVDGSISDLVDPPDVPEPETYALGLGVLALGAAGLRRWRIRNNQKQ
ncbi:hypothetical protein [Rubellicoccus peritrichatus]|uniref:PEP-CTERM protein-sorting domain-containing protein n=1 Tax=Rubellicoccus peritrichatus TaxID=3080537 RepID=A0AAQ3LCK7_9BACT|nr:hypothetical protein [Puniceicoccus sp. CR14]WOO42986.1 hypothetical protein RZN69_07765 [Puniceicoccus sp. CR14]